MKATILDAQIADELERRATLVCDACLGEKKICPRCAGTGRVPWPEMREIAQQVRNHALPF